MPPRSSRSSKPTCRGDDERFAVRSGRSPARTRAHRRLRRHRHRQVDAVSAPERAVEPAVHGVGLARPRTGVDEARDLRGRCRSDRRRATLGERAAIRQQRRRVAARRAGTAAGLARLPATYLTYAAAATYRGPSAVGTEIWPGTGNVEKPLRTVFTDPNHLLRWEMRTHAVWRETHIPHVREEYPHISIVRLRHPRETERWLAATHPSPR